MINRGWNEKNFGPKILVPWDTPGVTGAPISGGRDLMIWLTLFSGHMGSMWPPRHSGTSCSSRNSENGWSMVWNRPIFFLCIEGLVSLYESVPPPFRAKCQKLSNHIRGNIYSLVGAHYAFKVCQINREQMISNFFGLCVWCWSTHIEIGFISCGS